MTQTYHKTTYFAKIVILVLIVASLLFLIINRPPSVVTEKAKTTSTKAQVEVSDSIFSSTGKNSYKISAKRVTQSDDGVYFLNTISGLYHLDHKGDIHMNAHEGHFDSVLDSVELEKDVKVNYLGYDILSEQLNLDLKRYSARSPTMVHVSGKDGSIEAESFETTEEFNQIIFHGDVKADFIIHDAPNGADKP